MRFRFCGDLEAPTWLLHEVPTAATLAGGGLILVAVAAEVLAMDEAPA